MAAEALPSESASAVEPTVMAAATTRAPARRREGARRVDPGAGVARSSMEEPPE
ncbi:hypothetical protein GCM10010195_14110 [Kitasatospora griseola]|nr:hypothetical protein GCM10010195_14110 [Kitasatospora griseola]